LTLFGISSELHGLSNLPPGEKYSVAAEKENLNCTVSLDFPEKKYIYVMLVGKGTKVSQTYNLYTSHYKDF
jgi:hypothetical protein